MQPDNRDLLAQIVRNNPLATFVLDADHRVTHWNRACEIATGTPAAQVLGTTRAWAAFYPRERPVMADLIVDSRLGAVTDLYSGRCWPSRPGPFPRSRPTPRCRHAGTWSVPAPRGRWPVPEPPTGSGPGP